MRTDACPWQTVFAYGSLSVDLDKDCVMTFSMQGSQGYHLLVHAHLCFQICIYVHCISITIFWRSLHYHHRKVRRAAIDAAATDLDINFGGIARILSLDLQAYKERVVCGGELSLVEPWCGETLHVGSMV